MSDNSSGTSKNLETVGNLGAFNYNLDIDLSKTGYGNRFEKYDSDFYLQYPVQRSSNSGEDSFLIRCVKYKPPLLPQKVRDVTDYKVTYSDNKTPNDKSDDYEVKRENLGTRQEFGLDIGSSTGGLYNQHGSGYNGSTFSTDTQFYVELPIPKNVRDSNGCEWSGSSMNALTLAGINLASNLMERPQEQIQQLINNGITETVNDVFGSMGTDYGSVTASIKGILSGLAVNQLGANVTPNEILARSTGQILNSNKELLFSGPKLREFGFQFTFTPRDATESERARKIIRRMKKAMSPGIGESYAEGGNQNSLFLNSPHLFLLRYLKGGEDHPFLNSFKPCALKEFSVDYSATGAYATYGDGTPVHMSVTMRFQETNPIYAEDYDNPNISGVGY